MNLFKFGDIDENIMTEIEQIIQKLIRFRNERDWEQFHDSKNLALAISIEAAELNELFLWNTAGNSEDIDTERLKEELADVFAFSFLLAEKHGFDVKKIVMEKIKKNGEKYPVICNPHYQDHFGQFFVNNSGFLLFRHWFPIAYSWD